MTITKITPRRLYESVLDTLTTMISEGQLKPGEMLPPERELAEMFGVSRGTLREAFRILEINGCIISKPGGGRMVCDIVDKNKLITDYTEALNLAKLEDFYEVRMLVESHIALWAAERSTDEDIAALEKCLNEMTEQQYISGPMDEDYFHYVLAKATHNSLLLDILKMNNDILVRFRNDNPEAYSSRYQDVIAEHRRIFEAVKRHDPIAAKEAMEYHIQNGKKLVSTRKN